MIKNTPNSQAGFSAIELLITLFVAAAFIGAGYQLYTTILKSGGETRQRTTANNIAYDSLRRYTPYATAECTVQHYEPAVPADSGLSAPASIDVDITCPYGAGAAAVSKVNVLVSYGSPEQEVIHAIYVNGN